MPPESWDEQCRPHPVVTTPEAGLPATEIHPPFADYEDAIDFHYYLDVVLRRKWLVLTIALIVFVTALVTTLRMQPLFMASGRLEVNPLAPRVTKFQDITPTSYYSMAQDFIQTQISLLHSESLAERVVSKIDFAKYANHSTQGDRDQSIISESLRAVRSAVASAQGAVMAWLRSLLNPRAAQQQPAPAPGQAKSLEQRARAAWFMGHLSIGSEKDTNILFLNFSSPNPALARDVVNTLIDQFIGWEMDQRLQAAKTAKQQLEKQIELARIQLEKAETRLNRFAQEAGIVSLDSKMNLIYKELEKTNDTLAAVRADRVSKEALYNEATQDNIATLPMVQQNPMILRLRQNYADAAAKYQELHTTFKNDYPEVRNLKARMGDIKQQIEHEQTRILDLTFRNDQGRFS